MKDRDQIILEVHINFRRIKLTGKNYIYPVNKSVGFKGLTEFVGEDQAERYFRDALKSKEQNHVINLRRGLTIKFESI